MKNNHKNHCCPKCNQQAFLRRIKRNVFDRLISKVIPVRRYECYNCLWQGLFPRATSWQMKPS